MNAIAQNAEVIKLTEQPKIIENEDQLRQISQQCNDCEKFNHFCNANRLGIGVCLNPESDHYKHVIAAMHPSCIKFVQYKVHRGTSGG